MQPHALSRRELLQRVTAAAASLSLPTLVPSSVFGLNAPRNRANLATIRSDTISHLSDICIRLGRAIQWDPQKEQILNDAEAIRMLNRPLRAPWRFN
jgi:hypothetical protein